MRLPLWLHLLAWLLFFLAVLLPIAQIGLDAVYVDGRLDLSPFQALLFTEGQWTLMGNSLSLAIGATILAVVIGVPFAFLCQKTDLWGRSFFGLAYLVPLLVPPYMQAMVWGRLLAENGPINSYLMSWFKLGQPLLNGNSLPGAIVVLGLAYFPFVTLLTISGLKSVDSRFEEAALLYRDAFQTLIRVTVPLIRPHIIAGATFVFVFSIIDFGVADILRVRVYPIEIFVQFSALYDERAAVVLSLPLLLITAILIGLQVWSMKGRSYIALADSFSGNRRYALGRGQSLAVPFVLAVLGLSVLVPVGVLLHTSGSLTSYQEILGSSLGQIGFSLYMAALAATLMTVLAFFIAWSLVKSTGKRRMFLEYLTQLPFAIPPILLGIGLIKVWNRSATDWLYGSSLIIVLGYLAHFIPFTIRAIQSGLQQLNPHLEEMGWLSDKSRTRTTVRIIFPLVRNGLIAGFFISFILAMGELGVTLLVTPPGAATIPIKIYNYMHYGAEQTVAALCLTLTGFLLLFSVAFFGFTRWAGNDTG